MTVIIVCVAGMAVGNFVMSDMTSVMEIVQVFRNFVPIGPVWCHILVFLRTFSFSQSMLFISLVAVLRVWGGLASHYIGLSLKLVVASVVVIYSLSLTWAGVWLLPEWNTITVCMAAESEGSGLAVLIYLVITTALFIITVLSYCILFIGIRCKTAQTVALAGNTKSEILTLKAAVTVTIIFLLCFIIPFVPATFDGTSIGSSRHVLHVVNIFNSLAYLQSALNPYVYIATNSRFRRVYWKTWKRFTLILRCKRGEISPIGTSSGNNTSAQGSSSRPKQNVQLEAKNLDVPHASN